MHWLFKVSDFTHKQWRGTWLCFSLILLSFGNKGWSFLFYWNVVPAWLPTVKKPQVFLTPCQRGETRGIVLSQEGMDLSQACPSASYFHTLEHLPSTEHDESAAMKGILLLRSHPHTSPFSQLQRHTPLPGERLFLKHSTVGPRAEFQEYVTLVMLDYRAVDWIELITRITMNQTRQHLLRKRTQINDDNEKKHCIESSIKHALFYFWSLKSAYIYIGHFVKSPLFL